MKLKYRFLKIIICLVLLIFMLNFSVKRFENSKFENFKINIEEGHSLGFVNENNVKNRFYQMFSDTSHILVKQLEVQEIEKALRENEYIDSVNVYLDQSKNLNIFITQKKPVLRILDKSRSAQDKNSTYYIDNQGNEISISSQFSQPTLMIEGRIKEEEIPQLIELNAVIHEDKLLTKHIVGVRKEKDNSFILLVNVDDFRIEFGDLNDIEQKFKNLKAFYEQYLNQVGLGVYKKISVKYHNQIVATKK